MPEEISVFVEFPLDGRKPDIFHIRDTAGGEAVFSRTVAPDVSKMLIRALGVKDEPEPVIRKKPADKTPQIDKAVCKECKVEKCLYETNTGEPAPECPQLKKGEDNVSH